MIGKLAHMTSRSSHLPQSMLPRPTRNRAMTSTQTYDAIIIGASRAGISPVFILIRGPRL